MFFSSLFDRRYSIILIVGARNCTSTEFRCATSGACIPESWVCDHYVKISILFYFFYNMKYFVFFKDDCEDGSDENAELCREYLLNFCCINFDLFFLISE